MSRLPPKIRDQFSPEQQQTHDFFMTGSAHHFGPNGKNFQYADERGALIGPFPFFVYHQPMGDVLLKLIQKLIDLPLPLDVKEVAILATSG